MVRGQHLSQELKNLLFFHHFHLEKSSTEIIHDLFGGDNSFISEPYLRRLLNDLDKGEDKELLSFLDKPTVRGGRKRKVCELEAGYIS
jgi:hypothetical protein